uniref:Copia protein n=1 Tax=Cajanus cajan TaxID=3821 RepID=A0A151R040_CAJCA|nr:Copia protein [Cajanus cajan]
MHKPLEFHWKCVKRLLLYLSGTKDQGLLFQKSPSLPITGFADSDWAADRTDMRSTTGYCVYLGKNLVSWMAKKQHTVSRSSTEAEFRSLAATVSEITWIQPLLTELHAKHTEPPLIWCDNLGVVLLTTNPVLHSKSKHFELDLWFVRERVAQG